jgi:MFS family permease
MMSDLPDRPSLFSLIPKSMWAIGFGGFFINISSVMIRSVAAIYLKTILGVGTGWIGLLEGIVEGIAFAMKTFSGVISDYLRRRKLFIMIGYVLITISNPILAIWSTFAAAFISRVITRLGNGIQGTPRDALVADIAPPMSRGTCYGLRVGLGTAGSFVGAFIAWILMHWNQNDFQNLFWMATIPSAIAALIILFFVKEPEQNLHPKDHQPRHPIHWADLPRLGKPFWSLMAVAAVFMIGFLGEPLLALHAHHNFGLKVADVPLMLLTLNSTYSLSSFIVGVLSDRMSRYHLLALGFVVLIGTDFIFATAGSLLVFLIATALCGLQMGITQSLFMALVADTAPDDLRGTAFAVFYLINAVSFLLANVGTGVIAEFYGESLSFYASLAVAIIALLLLLVIMPKNRQKTAG